MKIWAHRGACAYAPENTLEAFALAARMGADGVELDVQMSADGALVVIHDTTVDRTSNGKGHVAELSLASLRALDFACNMPGYKNVKIPLLEEVYELLAPTALTINVEIKSEAVAAPGIWERLVAAERRHRMQERILYSSFNHAMLPLLRALDAHAAIGLLYSDTMAEPWAYAKARGATAIHPSYLTLLQTPRYVEQCKRCGIAVHTWTVNDPAAMLLLRDLGVDAIITNKPDVARGMLSVPGW